MNRIDIRFYYAIFVRRLPYFLLIFLAISVLGVAIALSRSPIYQADATILVENPQIPKDLARSTVVTDVAKQLQTIELKLMTRSELVPIANKFGLYRQEEDISADDIVDDMRSRTKIVPIQSNIPNDTGSAAFMLSFLADDPNTAADVVNEYVNIILQRSSNIRNGQASDTLQFFREETGRLGEKLKEIENKILNFKKENKDALPDSLNFRRSQQASLQDRLMQIEREESSLRDERSRLARIALSTSRDVDSGAMTPKERTLDQLRRVITEQRSIFSEASPSVIALRAQIVELEKEVQAEKSTDSAAPVKARGSSDTDLRLAEISQRLSLGSQEKVSINESLAALTKSIAATPAVDAELSSLEREHQNLQTQYGAATTRLADASAGQQIELGSKGERLSVLEAAIAPQSPISRKRRLIVAGSLVAGVAFGLGFIVLLEFLNESIRRPIELVRRLEIEPLVTIPYIKPEVLQPKRFISISSLILLLIGLPILAVMLRYYPAMQDSSIHSSEIKHWIWRMLS